MKYKLSYRTYFGSTILGFPEWKLTEKLFSASVCVKLFRLRGESGLYVMDRDIRNYLRVSSV